MTNSLVRLTWQKHADEDSNTKYVVERRYVPLSQPSAVSGLSFEGFGYVNFSNDPFDGGKKFKTKLSFRTSSPNGLLFVAFKSDWSSYAYLQLTNEKLKFAVKGDKGSVDVTAVESLSDGLFHIVEAEKMESNSDTLRLTVDGIVASRNDTKGIDIDVTVDNAYVGGVHPTFDVKSSALSQDSGFIGCMDVIQLDDDKSFDLQKYESYENVRFSNNGCPPAVQAGMHFRGTGYAKLNVSSSSSGRIRFGFRMRTSWPNGVLLAAYSDDETYYLFFEARIDGLDLRYRNSKSISSSAFLFRVRPRTVNMCDGAWHAVTLAIDASSLVVTVDGVAHKTSFKITDVKTYLSKIMENFYIGGMEDVKGSSPTMDEIALGYGVNVTSYGGCLADFKVNGQLIDCAKKRIASLNVSFAGCPDFTWGGPTCIDQVLRVGSKGEGEETLTDKTVEAFAGLF